jgi:hypothetical protein
VNHLKIIYCALICLYAWGTLAQRAPDYNLLHDWAAHPRKNDAADTVHAAFKNEQRDSAVDVFFIHPTSYTHNLRTSPWTADLDDAALNAATDSGAILNQASIFNARGRVFAPRYRQAHLKAFFLTRNPKSAEALELAYADVKAAFEYYLKHENNGRPIVIAAHSQGTRHAVRLLKEFFDGRPLQQQLVCAYLVGWTVMKDDFKHITLSTSPEQTGCYVTWRSMKTGYIDKYSKHGKGRITCSNPITWNTAVGKTNRSQHRGAMKGNLTQFYPNLVEVQVNVEFGLLWVNAGNGEMGNNSRMKNYHIGDYNLFYADVRFNVSQRVNAFLNR